MSGLQHAAGNLHIFIAGSLVGLMPSVCAKSVLVLPAFCLTEDPPLGVWLLGHMLLHRFGDPKGWLSPRTSRLAAETHMP